MKGRRLGEDAAENVSSAGSASASPRLDDPPEDVLSALNAGRRLGDPPENVRSAAVYEPESDDEPGYGDEDFGFDESDTFADDAMHATDDRMQYEVDALRGVGFA